jgi:molybdenum cofactor cytidylyltransferase
MNEGDVVSGTRDMAQIDTVILAAGSSSRLGFNKLCLKIDGELVIRRTVGRFLELSAGRVFVVTGFERERLEGLLHGLPLIFVHNREFSGGMSTSVRAALPCLSGTSGVFFHLGDKPLIKKETLDRMVEQYRRGGHPIVVPMHGGERGHPVLIDLSRYAAELGSLTGDAGLRTILENHNQDILYVEGDEGTVLDLDTEEEIDKVRRRGHTVEKG